MYKRKLNFRQNPHNQLQKWQSLFEIQKSAIQALKRYQNMST
jgi:hypothetical protein